MTDEKGRREVPVRNIAAESKRSEGAGRRLTQSLLDAGVSLAMMPVNMLPPEPRGHLKAAGRELTWGLASLTRKLADRLEKFAQESEEKAE